MANATTVVVAAVGAAAGGGNGVSWDLGWVRGAMGLTAPAGALSETAKAAAAMSTPSGTSKSVAVGAVGVLPAPSLPSLGAAPPIFMTPANGVRPLVSMLRGGTDPTVVMALRPAFQALSLRTKLAVVGQRRSIQ
jgi:hypothetical protein